MTRIKLIAVAGAGAAAIRGIAASAAPAAFPGTNGEPADHQRHRLAL